MHLDILICDDDVSYTDNLSDYFKGAQCLTDIFTKENLAISKFLEKSYDAILIERFRKNINGIKFTKFLRGEGIISPIIIYSKDAITFDVLEGLRAGADDYIEKYTDPELIYERILAILRGRKWANSVSDTIQVGKITLSLSRFKVTCNGTPVNLANLEIKLLAALMQRQGEILTREQITDLIWDNSKPPESNAIDQYILRIRSKLKNNEGYSPIKTIRGLGYKFQP